jgi:hypothetical protein
MKLKDLKQLLSRTSDRALRIQLADGHSVPESFHVTEVGQVTRTFIDCGGKVHATTACVLQSWLGSDVNHRLSSAKLGKILRMSETIIPVDEVPLEVEYERGVISQYPVTDATVSDSEIVLQLGLKHTACLAKEACGEPAGEGIRIKTAGGCC